MPDQQAIERPVGMELRVIINALALASALSKEETNRMRLEALGYVDSLEDLTT